MEPRIDLVGLMNLINKFNDPAKLAQLESDGKLALDSTKHAFDNLSKALLDLQQILED